MARLIRVDAGSQTAFVKEEGCGGNGGWKVCSTVVHVEYSETAPPGVPF